MDLIVRRLSLEGTANLTGLSEKLKLAYPVVDHLFRNMRQHHLVEVKGMMGNDYWITLSGAGRSLALERLHISKYAGAAPVSLSDYAAAVKAQAAEVDISRKSLRNALSDLVVTDQMLDSAIEAIVRSARTGKIGDGKIFVKSVEQVVRIRTGETDEAAI